MLVVCFFETVEYDECKLKHDIRFVVIKTTDKKIPPRSNH